MMNDIAIHGSCIIYFPSGIDGSQDQSPDRVQEILNFNLLSLQFFAIVQITKSKATAQSSRAFFAALSGKRIALHANLALS